MARVKLTEYQKRWLADKARHKVGRWARQTGKTFSVTLEAAIDCFDHPTMWIILSRGERQSNQAIKQAAAHTRVISKGLETLPVEEGIYTVDEAQYKMASIKYPNGSEFIGLPANPDTARGWSANIILDEFALHKDSREIWQALYPSITRGYKIRVVSTPQGRKNKFYEICTAEGIWSKHKIDIYEAVEQGLDLRDEEGKRATPEDLKRGLGDEEAWQQEYMVEFLDEATAFLTHDLIAMVESDQAEESPEWATSLSQMAREAYKTYLRTKIDPPWGALAGIDGLSGVQGDLYLGMDIGRRRDLTVIWLDEVKDGVAWTRAAIELLKQPFFVQKMVLFSLLNHPKMRRACLDRTGLGMQMAEEAVEKFGAWKVEGIDFTAANKEAMATGLKQDFEDMQSRIPISLTIRNSLHSVKKYQTATGHFRFDADRTEETGHADHFWAKALAKQAAGVPTGKIEYRSTGTRREFTRMGAYL
jgi:phage FluMu gp28-like protein